MLSAFTFVQIYINRRKHLNIMLAFLCRCVRTGNSFIRVDICCPSCAAASGVSRGTGRKVTLRVLRVIQRERVDPPLRARFTLIPVVERTVLKVALGFVRADCEGGARHGQRVTVQQWREVVHGAQYPADGVVGQGQEPEEQRGDANPPEAETGEEQHVEVLVALVGRVVVAEEGLAAHCLRTLSQRSGCQHMHPRHVACERKDWREVEVESGNRH